MSQPSNKKPVKPPLGISRTPPLRDLLFGIGKTTYWLNTLCVGLECVAQGHGTTGAVALKWSLPKIAGRRRKLADDAGMFARNSALVFVTDVFDSYLRQLAMLSWLDDVPEIRAVAAKAKSRAKRDGGAYSVAERADVLCDEFGVEDPIHIAALDLLVRWRNVAAHSADRPLKFDAGKEATLLAAGTGFAKSYPLFDMKDAIKSFKSRRPPAPECVGVLVASVVRLSRKIDEAAIRRYAGSQVQLRDVADQVIARHFDFATSGRPALPRSDLLKFQHGGPPQRLGIIRRILAAGGITATKQPVSATLDEHYLRKLSAMTREQLENHMQGVLQSSELSSRSRGARAEPPMV